jgi:hypothetical protein
MDTARQRLVRTFLTTKPWTSARDVVRALGAVQAQDYDGAKWALSQRTLGLSDDQVEKEFADGELIRTHVLRPTWHFVDPADLRWLLALTGPRVMRTMSSYDRKLELDEKVFRRSNAALERALRGGTLLTRAELKTALGRARVGDVGGQRTAHLLMRAELEGIICSGPRRGKQFTYALLDERVPTTPALDRDQALLELTRRYFHTRGPATAADYSWWSGLVMADVRRAIEIAREDLVETTIDGRTFWNTGERLARPRASAHLLPNYDEFFIGYRDRGAIGNRLNSVKAVTGGTTLIAHVIVVDGQLVGGWRRTVGSAAVRLDLEVLTRLTPGERKRVLGEVRRYRAFVGRPIDLRGLDPDR